MPTYIYKARDATGKSVKGKMEASRKDELTAKLRRMGYVTTRVKEAMPGLSLDGMFTPFRKVGTEDMVVFSVQLSNMINAGVPILASLQSLGYQIEHKRFKEELAEIARSVEGGSSLSEALEAYPRTFSKIFVSMVRAGEASGKLDMILTRLAIFIEQQADLKQKVQSAVFYPLILLAAGLLVVLYIVTFVIPQFAEIFMKAGIRLPAPTLMLYEAGTALKKYWFLVPVIILGPVVAIRTYAGTRGGKFHVDSLKLRLPVFGRLYRKVAVARFGRTLGMLAASGVPILQSLDIVREIVGNEVIGRVVTAARISVEKGEKISESLNISKEFPSDVVRMIAVGEETGSLDAMLDKVADFYDRWIDYSIKKLVVLIEPLLLVILGSLVGFIMASILLPIFDMMKILRLHR